MDGISDDPVARVLAAFREEAQGVASRADFERLKGRFLGREKGLVPGLFLLVKGLAREERAAFGSRANAAKSEIEAGIARLAGDLTRQEAQARERAAAVDVTLPGRRPRLGGLHPVTIVRRRIEEIFLRMGYSIADGPELEDDLHNFEALNFPPEHPARDTQDTFFVLSGGPGGPPTPWVDRKAASPLLLRTHTSPVQIREMKRRGAPLRIIAPGRVYRKDEVDATHSPLFHQVEALVVDRGISMADLKGTVEYFLSELFGKGTRARFIPTFFPFVEPGVDVHMTCFFCRGTGTQDAVRPSAGLPAEDRAVPQPSGSGAGDLAVPQTPLGCGKCKGSGWIEIMGAGEVHPNVLRGVGIDPEEFSGFAFGLGLDRVALLLYEFPDLRLLFEGDERFLSQFARER